MHWEHQFDAIVRPWYQELQASVPHPHEDYPTTGLLCAVSQDTDGTSYQVRLEIGDLLPILRIIVPTTHTSTSPAIFRVQLTPQAWLTRQLTQVMHLQGSAEIQELQSDWHASLAFMIGDLMKALFWQGNLDDCWFPPEIIVVQEY